MLFHQQTIESTWQLRYYCRSCNHRLTEHQRIMSNGICPYCGYNSKNIICNCIEKIEKTITTITVDSNFPFYHSKTLILEKKDA